MKRSERSSRGSDCGEARCPASTANGVAQTDESWAHTGGRGDWSGGVQATDQRVDWCRALGLGLCSRRGPWLGALLSCGAMTGRIWVRTGKTKTSGRVCALASRLASETGLPLGLGTFQHGQGEHAGERESGDTEAIARLVAAWAIWAFPSPG